MKVKYCKNNRTFFILLNTFIFLYICVQSSCLVEAHIHISDELYTKKATPVEILVDTTNNLAYRILYYHSISNRNNFAFSPSSLISVITALYEGSYGRSYSELQNFLELPVNKDTSRIGLRDIHRRLRTYKFPQDNPLNGLSLSKENITITPQYEAILKFYGYDLDFDMRVQTFISEMFMNGVNNTDVGENEKEEKSLESILRNGSISTQNSVTEAVTSRISLNDTTTLRNDIESVTIITTTESTTTTKILEDITTYTTTIKPSTTTEIITTEASELAAYIQPKTNFSVNSKIRKISDFWPTSVHLSRQINNTETSAIRLNSRKNKINQIKPNMRNKRFLANEFTNFFQPTNSPVNFWQYQSSVLNPFINGAEPYLSNIESSEPLLHPIPSYVDPVVEFVNAENYGIEFGDSRYFFPKETSLKNTINHIFYLNNYETIQTNYKTYNSILNYKYLTIQKLTILELELNSPNYNLMIFLPDFNIGLDSTVTHLKYIPSLRNLRKQMKPKLIQAIIPDLKLRGKIYLTNDLQNMGVKDIFEPSRADFSLMSSENDIYVKHIEQIIDVNIRTRPIDQVKGNIAQQFQPIEVVVNHPFLFFVVDKEIDVVILAGRALNPLNLRIQ